MAMSRNLRKRIVKMKMRELRDEGKIMTTRENAEVINNCIEDEIEVTEIDNNSVIITLKEVKINE